MGRQPQAHERAIRREPDLVLPTFLGIGAQRAGTTWLFENLRTHPDVYVPEVKEINFFASAAYQKGLDWYAGFFRAGRDRLAVGEMTPEYLLHPEAARRIKKTLGRVKLIAILRNPIERLVSAYARGLREGDWSCTLEEFIRGNVDHCVDRGLYWEQLRRYLALFPREDFFVGLYEDIEADPIAFLRGIYVFLGVPSEVACPLARARFNVGVVPRGRRSMSSVLLRVRNVAYRTLPRPVARGLVKLPQRVPALNRWLSRGLTRDRLRVDEHLGRRLVSRYQKDVEALGVFLGRDLLREWLGQWA